MPQNRWQNMSHVTEQMTEQMTEQEGLEVGPGRRRFMIEHVYA
jgi:hypothetical protein